MTGTRFQIPRLLHDILEMFHLDPNRISNLEIGGHYTRNHPDIFDLDGSFDFNLLDWIPLASPHIRIDILNDMALQCEITFRRKVVFTYEHPARCFVDLPTGSRVHVRDREVRIPDVFEYMHPTPVSHDPIERTRTGRRVHINAEPVRLGPYAPPSEASVRKSVKLTEILAFNRTWIQVPELEGETSADFIDLALFVDLAGTQPEKSQYLDTWIRSPSGSDWRTIPMARRDPLSKEEGVWITPVRFLRNLLTDLGLKTRILRLRTEDEELLITEDSNVGQHRMTLPGPLYDVCRSYRVDPFRFQQLAERNYCSPSAKTHMSGDLTILNILPASFPITYIHITPHPAGDENRLKAEVCERIPKPVEKTPYHQLDREKGRMIIHMGDAVHLFSLRLPKSLQGPPQRIKTREIMNHVLNIVAEFPQIHHGDDCLEIEMVSWTLPDSIDPEVAIHISNASYRDDPEYRYRHIIPVQNLTANLIERSANGRPLKVHNGDCATIHSSRSILTKGRVDQIDGEAIHQRSPQVLDLTDFTADPATKILIECERFACAITELADDPAMDKDSFRDVTKILTNMGKNRLIKSDDLTRERFESLEQILLLNRLNQLRRAVDALGEN